MRKHNFAVFVLLALLTVAAGYAQHHGSNQAQQGKPGVFDYYLLTLSWSPEFCHSHADKPECQSGHHGFVVHGLWPQYADGYPENCSNAPGLSNPAQMADIMPGPGLVAHE
jgi:ribonuclease T2